MKHTEIKTIHTCPMHPGVEHSGPSSCPKCGMALEPTLPPQPSTRIEYTCPMHPEVIRSEPGNCPKCGMALERTVATAIDDEDNPELRDMTRRFGFSAALSVPIVVLAMGDMVLPGSPIHDHLHWRVSGAIEFLLATVVVLWGGWPLLVRGVIERLDAAR